MHPPTGSRQLLIGFGFMNILGSRYFAWILLALPAAFMIRGYVTETLYYGELMHATGEVSARLLILTMAISPFRLILPHAKWPLWLQRRRRYFGVATFGYALLHTLFYLQKTAQPSEALSEALDFEYWTGWAGVLIFGLLALTSNEGSVRVLKSAWKKLHRWAYAAAILSFLHWIFVAFNFIPALIHAFVLALLETIRLWKSRKVATA
jgi:sulfoxide reductase heme-binding subunit YedZ